MEFKYRYYSIWFDKDPASSSDEGTESFILTEWYEDGDMWRQTEPFFVNRLFIFGFEGKLLNKKVGFKCKSVSYNRLSGNLERSSYGFSQKFGSSISGKEREALERGFEYGILDYAGSPDGSNFGLKKDDEYGFVYVTPDVTIVSEYNPIAYHNRQNQV